MQKSNFLRVRYRDRRKRPKDGMVAEAERVWAIAQEQGIAPRTAAYVHALNRVGDAVQAKGTKDYFTDGQ